MAAILYLDVDDEITSAAARIRGSADPKVVLVIPPGSRIATSRMNFRLLAREALERNRGLSIVAPDPAARAIAGSAGLPVFASVAEFEASIAPPPVEPAMPVAQGAGDEAGSADLAGPAAVGLAAAGASAASPSPLPSPAPSASGKRRGAAAVAAAGATGSVGVDPGTDDVGSGSPGPSAATGSALPRVGADGPGEPSPTTVLEPVAPVEPRARSGAAAIPIVPATPRSRGVSRWLVVAAIAVVALAALGIAGYLVLPAATVVVTPDPVKVGPVDFVVRADPDATSVDAAGGVVPATRLSKDFSASGEFKSTGKRVVQTKAAGTLRWTNCDPTRPHTIAAGSVARTSAGIGFSSDESVFLPVAILKLPSRTLTCQSRDAPATAVKAGPEGNVAAGTIRQVPGNQNSVVVEVTNPAAMSGGQRQEFARVSAKDVAAATASLAKDLKGQFAAWVAAPDGAPAGATVFPATGKPGTPVVTPDPTTLVDVEEPTFQLAATATGTVVAVDPSIVEQVATERITGSVPSDHRLVPGSVRLTTDSGQADGDLVDFRVTAIASAIPVLDVAVLREAIKGRPVEEAERLLKRYGAVTIDTWPGFVSTIPTLDSRIDIRITDQEGGTSPSPQPSATEPSGAEPSASNS